MHVGQAHRSGGVPGRAQVRDGRAREGGRVDRVPEPPRAGGRVRGRGRRRRSARVRRGRATRERDAPLRHRGGGAARARVSDGRPGRGALADARGGLRTRAVRGHARGERRRLQQLALPGDVRREAPRRGQSRAARPGRARGDPVAGRVAAVREETGDVHDAARAFALRGERKRRRVREGIQVDEKRDGIGRGAARRRRRDDATDAGRASERHYQFRRERAGETPASARPRARGDRRAGGGSARARFWRDRRARPAATTW